MTPQQFCHNVCKKSGSNFVYTFYLLGKKRRLALEAFYAFCRIVDDSVDQAATPDIAREKIGFWKEEVLALYEGRPRHLVSKALQPVVACYSIPQNYLSEIVAGCETDLVKKSYATFEELENYCFKVASCVGLVCLHLFGVSLTITTEQAAIALGKALQLTNILRDIVSDLGKERVYIPQEHLKCFGVSIADLSGRTDNCFNLLDLLYFEIGQARLFFSKAWEAFPKSRKERRALLAAILMGHFYEALLDKISKDPLAIFRSKVKLKPSEKLKIAAKEIWAGLIKRQI